VAEVPLKIIFAGTPQFAAIALAALIQSPHQVAAVFTQPDRPAGRGLQLHHSPVKELAQSFQIPVFQPLSLKDPKEQASLLQFGADVMVVAAYGMLLPEKVLNIPRWGCINIHPSLLPRWRGAAPIQRSILAGDKETGVTIMQMDAGLDTGPILLKRSYLMDENETAQTLHDKMAKMGADCLIESLNLLRNGKIKPTPQDNHLATYSAKISKEEAQINWSEPAILLEQQIRAFNPKPVAYTTWKGERLRIWMAKARPENAKGASPGTLLKTSAEGLDVATGEGVLRLLQVQMPGGKTIPISDFYRARADELLAGQSFGNTANL
jgi:methionyl-tRNA formyltransferase